MPCVVDPWQSGAALSVPTLLPTLAATIVVVVVVSTVLVIIAATPTIAEPTLPGELLLRHLPLRQLVCL